MSLNIMLDLETLSTRPNAAIVQIGLYPFDPTMPTWEGDTQLINVEPQSVIDAGFHVDWKTLLWWMDHPDAMKTLASPGAGWPIKDALVMVANYLNRFPYAEIWGNGAAFDPPVLENAFHRMGLDVPWSYRNVRCMRTLKALWPSVPRVEPELAHNALSDAKAQAKWVTKVLSPPPVIGVDVRVTGGGSSTAVIGGQSFASVSGAPATLGGQSPEPLAAASGNGGAAPVDTIEASPEFVNDLIAFHDAAAHHDWWWNFADDQKAYDAGRADFQRLAVWANKSIPHQMIWESWMKWFREGAVQDKKPVRPLPL